MPTNSVLALSIAHLLEQQADSATRYIDLELSLLYRPERDAKHGEYLVTVGGTWDKRERRYVHTSDTGRVIELQPAQVAAARWLCRWFVCYKTGNWRGFRRVWSALFHGGRRGGKSNLACVALVVFGILCPGSRIFAVSPTIKETDELLVALRALLPCHWYRYRGEPKNELTLVNASRIKFESGFKPGKLKQGRVDFALYNEGQKMDREGFRQLRGGAADSGALVLVTANPPDKPIGMWVQEFKDGVEAGERKAEAFFFDPRLNYYIDHDSLEAMALEDDEHTFRREVLGEFVPIGDVVFHAWSDVYSKRAVPAHYVDVTREVSRKLLGRAVDTIIGADFDKTPHLAAAVCRLYRDPDDPNGEAAQPLLWVIAEAVVELSDEDGLADALETLPNRHELPGALEREALIDKQHAIVIADASGDFQGTERIRGKSSYQILQKRGFRVIKPDKRMEKNPLIVERVKAGNAALRSHAGRRRLFASPICKHTCTAMKRWEMRNHMPYRKSNHAHMCDAVTYVVWRLWGRIKRSGKPGYVSIGRKSRLDKIRRL